MARRPSADMLLLVTSFLAATASAAAFRRALCQPMRALRRWRPERSNQTNCTVGVVSQFGEDAVSGYLMLGT